MINSQMWLQHWTVQTQNVSVVEECSMTTLLWRCKGALGDPHKCRCRALRDRGQKPPPCHLFERAALMLSSVNPVLGGETVFPAQRGSLKTTTHFNLIYFTKGHLRHREDHELPRSHSKQAGWA